jgi:hypothetical protein
MPFLCLKLETGIVGGGGGGWGGGDGGGDLSATVPGDEGELGALTPSNDGPVLEGPYVM